MRAAPVGAAHRPRSRGGWAGGEASQRGGGGRRWRRRRASGRRHRCIRCPRGPGASRRRGAVGTSSRRSVAAVRTPRSDRQPGTSARWPTRAPDGGGDGLPRRPMVRRGARWAGTVALAAGRFDALPLERPARLQAARDHPAFPGLIAGASREKYACGCEPRSASAWYYARRTRQQPPICRRRHLRVQSRSCGAAWSVFRQYRDRRWELSAAELLAAPGDLAPRRSRSRLGGARPSAPSSRKSPLHDVTVQRDAEEMPPAWAPRPGTAIGPSSAASHAHACGEEEGGIVRVAGAAGRGCRDQRRALSHLPRRAPRRRSRSPGAASRHRVTGERILPGAMGRPRTVIEPRRSIAPATPPRSRQAPRAGSRAVRSRSPPPARTATYPAPWFMIATRLRAASRAPPHPRPRRPSRRRWTMARISRVCRQEPVIG